MVIVTFFQIDATQNICFPTGSVSAYFVEFIDRKQRVKHFVFQALPKWAQRPLGNDRVIMSPALAEWTSVTTQKILCVSKAAKVGSETIWKGSGRYVSSAAKMNLREHLEKIM